MKPTTIIALTVIAGSLTLATIANKKANNATKDLAQAHKLNTDITAANKELAFALGVYKQNVVDIVSEYQKLYNVYTNNIAFVKENFNIVLELPAKYDTRDAVKRK